MDLRLLHTNDFHGKLDTGRVERLRAWRAEVDGFFDSGDLIRTGNLGVPLRPDPGWAGLARAGCTASVPGNRESQIFGPALRAKLAGAEHPVLCANLFDRQGERPLPGWQVFSLANVRVGVFGVMVPMVTAQMRTQRASTYLWTSAAEAAAEAVAALRAEGADVIIALTHIGFRQDEALAEQVPGIDIILGGHSHTVLEAPVRTGATWIAQGGSHGRFAGVYRWDGDRLTGQLRSLS